MSKVTITPSKKGELVTPYEGNDEYGYLLLAQTKSGYVNGWLKESTNRTILKGKVDALKSFIKDNPSLEVVGNLVVKEYLEDEIPASMSSTHFDSKLTFEEQISNYVKRAGTDGPVLKSDNKRIIRFVVWDQSGEDTSMTIAHENVEEVTAYNKQKANAEANLD